MKNQMLLVVVGALLAGCATAPRADQLAAMDRMRQELIACQAQLGQPGATQVSVMSCKTTALTKGYSTARYPYMDLVYNLEGQAVQWAADTDAGRLSQSDYTAKKQVAQLQMQAEETRRNQAAGQARAQAIAGMFQGLSDQAAQNAAALQAQAQAAQNNRPSSTNCVTSYIGTQAYTDCRTAP